jgi:hypothetical protein
MKRRIFLLLTVVSFLIVPVKAEPLKWVNFEVPYESLKYAMDADIRTAEQECHISWIDILAVAGCKTGGKCDLASVKKALEFLQTGKEPGTLTHYDYYHRA